jgi:putative transposase
MLVFPKTSNQRGGAMVESTVDGISWLHKRIAEADVDLLREMVSMVVQALMSADADSKCGAPYGERSEGRVTKRNGYRNRRWDSRVGTISLAIPKLRRGTYFPDWLLEPRRRAEKALTQVVAECYVRGVSTRRVDGLVQTLGLDGMSKSQVSELAKELDSTVEDFRSRRLDRGPYRYLWLDAMTQRVREGGRVVNVAVVLATSVNTEGRREVLGCEVITSEDGAGWLSFLRSLVARGLTGVCYVVSDAHPGLKAAISSVLSGAAWNRCRTHFMSNLLTKVPRSAQRMVATMVRSIYTQPTSEEVWAQHGRIVGHLQKKFPDATSILADAAEEILAFTAFPKEHWRQIWSNNPQERLNKEIRRRTDVVGIFPNRAAVIRLVGALLAEQTDEWEIGRRYMSMESLMKVIGAQEAQKKLPKGKTKGKAA